MTNGTDRREWVSPLTLVLFAAISVTGILIWLHLRVPGVTLLHELAGIVFTVVAGVHLALNWRSLCVRLRRRKAWLTLLAAVALCAAAVLVDLAHEGHRDGGPRHGRHERDEHR